MDDGSGSGMATPPDNSVPTVDERYPFANVGIAGPTRTYGHDSRAHEAMIRIAVGGSNGSTGGSGGGSKVLAYVSAKMSGPFDVGSEKDKHRIGTDADGHAINADHLSLGSYFRLDDTIDGPLAFNGPYEISQKGPIRMECHFEWDNSISHGFKCGTRQGVYRWHSYCMANTPTDGCPPYTPRNPPPPSGPPPVPTNPFGVPVAGPTQPGYGTWVAGGGIWRTTALPMEVALPAILARPQFSQANVIDFRNWPTPSDELLRRMEHDTPITGRIEAFGKQITDNWVYTEKPCAGPSLGGTGPGGFVVMPAQVGLQDSGSTYAPAGRTISPTYFGVLATNAYFAAGLPDTSTGAFKTGYRWGVNSAGLLSFDSLSAAGAATSRMTLNSAGVVTIPNELDLGQASGQTGTLRLFNAASAFQTNITAGLAAANRTYTWPPNFGISGSILVDSTGAGVLGWRDVLPIANGGTNSATALANNRIMISSGGAVVELAARIANRVLFTDANGLPTDSANLTFDGTTLTALQNLRVGTPTDGAATQGNAVFGLTGAQRVWFDVANQRISMFDSLNVEQIRLDAALKTGFFGTLTDPIGGDFLVAKGFLLAWNDGGNGGLRAAAYGVSGSTNRPTMAGFAARGTQPLPTAVQNTDELLRVVGNGYNSAAFVNGALMLLRSTETWTATATGSQIAFVTIANTTTTQITRLTIDQDGTVFGVDATTDLGRSANRFREIWSSLRAEANADQSVTNSTVLVDSTSLTVSVLASGRYRLRGILFWTTASVTAGIRVALSGTATATDLKAQIIIFSGTGIAASTRVTTLGTAVGSAVPTGNNIIAIEGDISVNAAGTFLVQFAQQVADAANATTLQARSHWFVERIA